MKASIKIVTVKKEFTPKQIQILRRVMSVLEEHDMCIAITTKQKRKNITEPFLKIA